MKKNKYIEVKSLPSEKHKICRICGYCITCGDCSRFGCGFKIRKKLKPCVDCASEDPMQPCEACDNNVKR